MLGRQPNRSNSSQDDAKGIPNIITMQLMLVYAKLTALQTCAIEVDVLVVQMA